MKAIYSFDYEKYNSLNELSAGDRSLVDEARKACTSSFAPYSGFKVGSAARLRSGKVLTGANQESEVFPAGLCAERIILYHWQSHYPDDPIESFAIASVPGERECYPCGQCRQVLLDTERRQGSPIRIIMSGDFSSSAIPSARALLPLQFELE